jgi:hypothetical protein
MRLIGELKSNNRIVKTNTVELKDSNVFYNDFRSDFESLFLKMCRDFDIPVPVWLSKNTKELSRYRKTFFSKDHFIGDISFDEFIIKLELET